MRYFHRTTLSPDEVLAQAKAFFGTRLAPADEAARRRTYAGGLGKVTITARAEGGHRPRSAARQPWPSLPYLPPRNIRWIPPTPTLNGSAHHCQTLPCMSHNPSLFGGYAPTRVVRSRLFPFGALPKGNLPLKLACSEERSLVGLSK